MPKCEGLPGGQCPQNVNNRTVKLTQGDLMLCPSCDAVRFPVTARSDHTKPQLLSAKNTVKKNSDKRKPNLKAVTSKSGTISDNDDDEDNYCAVCSDSISGRSIKCDICNCHVHDACSGVATEILTKLHDIVEHTGWVCLNCRTNCRKKIDQLQVALTKVTEKLSDVLATVVALEDKVQQITATPNQPSSSDIAVEVHRTLNDVSRRKCNIVVSGLPEPVKPTNDTDDDFDEVEEDKSAFLALCEDHFSVKPALSNLGCRRLGKVSDQQQQQQPRKLLVHLMSEDSAKQVLSEAKKLRRSDDGMVAASVFINPDRSPAEAKLAFERRQQRREAQRKRTQQATIAVSAASVDPVAESADTPYSIANSSFHAK